MINFFNVGVFAITILTLMVLSSLFGTIYNTEAQAQVSNYNYNSNNLVTMGPVQTNIATSTQIGGAVQTAEQEQSNVINTNQKGTLVNFGGVQVDVGVITQVGDDDQTVYSNSIKLIY